MSRTPSGQLVERVGKNGTTYAARVRSGGRRHYITLGSEGWTRQRAEFELDNILADVRRGIWQPPTAPKVTAPKEEPTFHEFSSAWVARREGEVEPRTAEHWRWALTCHLLPALTRYKVGDFTPEVIDSYKAAKVREREQQLVDRPLSNGSINKTLKVLAQILDDAVEYGHLDANPARGRRRRLKATRPKRTWLEPDEVRDLLDAAGDHRALLATMVLAGLRVGEAAALRWRNVDLAGGKLVVERSKTDAGQRAVDVSPGLLEELKLQRAASRHAEVDDFVFGTRQATERKRSNISRQILKPAIEAANKARAKAGRPPIQSGVTNHSLRRTFASLLYEAGASPAYVMAQMGHTSSALALEVYAKKMDLQRDTGARMDALIRPADWAQMGTNSETNETDSTALPGRTEEEVAV